MATGSSPAAVRVNDAARFGETVYTLFALSFPAADPRITTNPLPDNPSVSPLLTLLRFVVY